MKKPKDEQNRLQQANEEKKKKLIDECGAYFGKMSENTDLPPEIESQFLDNIMAFENAWQNTKRITIYDFLGKPAYRKMEVLTDKDVTKELHKLMNCLNDHRLRLDTLCDVDDRELYRFITDELFLEEVDDMHIPGVITCFTYEEFHPNHEYDIRRYSHEFISSYLDINSDSYSHELSLEAEKQDWHKHFRESFSLFELKTFEIEGQNYNLDLKEAHVYFECEIIGEVEGSDDRITFKGNGEIQFVYQFDFWYVNMVTLPQGVLSKKKIRL